MSNPVELFNQLHAEVLEVGALGQPIAGQVIVDYTTGEHTVDMMFMATGGDAQSVTRIVEHGDDLPVAATIVRVSQFVGLVSVEHMQVEDTVDAVEPAARYAAILASAEPLSETISDDTSALGDMLADAQAFSPNE